MIRFSCFQAHTHSHKHKKTVQLSGQAMQKGLEDSSQIQNPGNLSYLAAESKPCLKDEQDTADNVTDHATDSSPTEPDFVSEELKGKYSVDSDIMAPKNAQIKKSQSLGSRLNWEEVIRGVNGSEDDIEHVFSYDGYPDSREIFVSSGIDNHGHSPSDQFPEPTHSYSAQVNSDSAKGRSIFSVGHLQDSEKEGVDQDDAFFSGAAYSDGCTPCIQPAIVKSSSLPSMGSANQIQPVLFKSRSTPFLQGARSPEDLSTLDGKKKCMMHEVGEQLQDGESESAIRNNDKGNGEIHADETYGAYGFVGSAEDCMIMLPCGANMEKVLKGETSFHHWDELPAKDIRLKRTEDWVIDLQHCSAFLESNESTSCDNDELPKGDASLEESTAVEVEGKINPGTEAAKRYISSLNASATAAQMSNLGLVAIPFLSAFVSLKALNLSGNAIVRITAGALPRGLHILNLSKNSIATIEGLRDLTRLRVLDLSYNRILRVGHGLSACSSLKELYLAGNKIGEVEGLHRLLKLNVLDLRFNKISTTKCLGQLAANYNCLQAFSLEGNPAQKNVGDEQLKKYVQSLLPHLAYYNRRSIKAGTMTEAGDRSARLGISAHQIGNSLRMDVKNTRKGTHGIAIQKVSSPSIHGRKGQLSALHKPNWSRHGHHLSPAGTKTTALSHQFTEFSSKLRILRNDVSIPKSRSDGNLGAL